MSDGQQKMQQKGRKAVTTAVPKQEFLNDLRTRIRAHVERVETIYAELEPAQLLWQPSAKEWSVLHCFDHMALTFDYYRPRIDNALQSPAPLLGNPDVYAPSRWGRIYMYFSINPRYSFPTAAAITPVAQPDRTVFDRYLGAQAALLDDLERVGAVDLARTRIPIEKGVRFNLGDVFKFLVYHDEVHFLQAQGVLAQQGISLENPTTSF